MMKNILENIYKDIISKWGDKNHKGVGTITCLNNIDYSEIIVRIINLMKGKNSDLKCLIVVGNWTYRNGIVNNLKNNNIDLKSINILTYSYVNARYIYSYDITISVGVNEWNLYCNTAFCRAKFKLFIITDDKISTDKLNKIYSNIPPINNTVDYKSLTESIIYSPVEEIRHSTPFLTDEDSATYDKYSEYISNAIQVFGNLDNINCAIRGTKDGRSSMQFITEIANYNGWSEDMDMNNPFSKEIDRCYNPIVLKDLATTCYSIMHERRKYCSSNNCKLETIISILKDNPNKQFVIISSSSDFAATVTKHINENLGEIAGDCHDNIEPKLLLDNAGNIVLYKSGINKGKPRTIKSKAISKLNLNAFNEGRIRVLSIKNNSTVDVKIKSSDWIITSSLCDSIKELQYRHSNIQCAGVLNVHKLYIPNTIEETELKKDKPDINHNIINDSNNFSEISFQ